MKKILLIIFILSPNFANATGTPVDSNANAATVAQYNQLLNAPSQSKIYAGTELLKNESEEYDLTTSSFRQLAGHNPYVYGWHFDFLSVQPTIATTLSTHARNGGIIDIIFNGQSAGVNFMTNGDDLIDVLPGGTHRTEWLAFLDGMATFFNSIQDASGNKLPVTFRLFPELDLPNFWWAAPSPNSASNFVTAWQDAVTYLRDTKGVHNVIYVWQPGAGGYSIAAGTNTYPGDSWVDVIGVECYDTSFSNCITGHQNFQNTATEANNRNKPWVISEYGNGSIQSGGGFIESYWTTISTQLFGTSFAKMPSFIMSWTSPSYGPLVGRADQDEFQAFISHSTITLLDYTNSELQNSTKLIGNTSIVGGVGLR